VGLGNFNKLNYNNEMNNENNNKKIYSGALLIRTPLIQMLHYPDDISGEQTV
jgi:hypothetical protein